MICVQGIQKLTLLDYPGRVACTLFTGGCNFRCPFCQNSALLPCHKKGDLDTAEVLAFLEQRRKKGLLDGVCITGGEPLLQEDIADFLKELKQMGYAVKLDTNGSYPEKLKYLVHEGLIDYVAMDIKNAISAYEETAGIDGSYLEAVQESVAFLKEGTVAYEFRTTVTKNFHTAERFEEIGKWIQGADRYFLQAFVDSGDLISPNIIGCDAKEMNEFLSIVKPYIPNARLRGI